VSGQLFPLIARSPLNFVIQGVVRIVELILKEVTFRYPQTRQLIFSRLSARLPVKGFNAIFGLSGCGKSTLARLMAGLEMPDSGRIQLLSEGPDHFSGREPKILYAWNGERLPGWQQIAEHFHQVAPETQFQVLDHLCRWFDLQDLATQKFGSLSLGQKNRANLIRYLVQDFDLLILDEVLANVDEPMRHRILALLKTHFSHSNILYISHSALEVAAFARNIFLLPPSAGSSGCSEIKLVKGLNLSEISSEMMPELQDGMVELLRLASGLSLTRNENGRIASSG